MITGAIGKRTVAKIDPKKNATRNSIAPEVFCCIAQMNPATGPANGVNVVKIPNGRANVTSSSPSKALPMAIIIPLAIIVIRISDNSSFIANSSYTKFIQLVPALGSES
jgi:hypothetical protein